MSRRKLALVSVTDKTGLFKLRPLVANGWGFISTGGTATELGKFDIPHIPVQNFTGIPEMMDGRLKTLVHKLFGGTLADINKPSDMAALAEHGMELIDLVVVNLYQFEERPSIKEIDIGGPSHLRAAAKNSNRVPVVVDPKDYGKVVKQLIDRGEVDEKTREDLAIKVFERTASYDTAISQWMKRSRRKKIHFLR